MSKSSPGGVAVVGGRVEGGGGEGNGAPTCNLYQPFGTFGDVQRLHDHRRAPRRSHRHDRDGSASSDSQSGKAAQKLE